MASDERTTWGLDDLEALQEHWPLEVEERLVPLSDLRIALARAEAAERERDELDAHHVQRWERGPTQAAVHNASRTLIAQRHNLTFDELRAIGEAMYLADRPVPLAPLLPLLGGATREEQT